MVDMTIKDLRSERELLEKTINELLVAFNRKTDTPISDITFNTTRISAMYEVDTYLYDIKIEIVV